MPLFAFDALLRAGYVLSSYENNEVYYYYREEETRDIAMLVFRYNPYLTRELYGQASPNVQYEHDPKQDMNLGNFVRVLTSSERRIKNPGVPATIEEMTQQSLVEYFVSEIKSERSGYLQAKRPIPPYIFMDKIFALLDEKDGEWIAFYLDALSSEHVPAPVFQEGMKTLALNTTLQYLLRSRHTSP